MPLFFANARHGQNRRQRGQTDRTEYQRSSPSGVLTVVHAQAVWTISMLYTFMYAVLKSTANGNDRQEAGTTDTISYFQSKFSIARCLPFPMPKIAICLDTNNPPTRVIEKLEDLGFTLQQVKGARTPVYTKDFPSVQDASAVMTIPGLDRNFRPPFGYVTPSAIAPMFRLLVAVSSILDCSRRILAYHEIDTVLKLKTRVKANQSTTATEGEDDDMEEGEEREEPQWAFTDDGKIDSASTIAFLVDNGKFAEPKHTYMGKIEHRPRSAGIFCPYEPNYSQPDVNAIGLFCSRFQMCLASEGENADEQSEALMYYWTREIAKTAWGEYMAHVIKALDLCAQSGSYMYCMFRPGGHYDGCVMYCPEGTRIRKMGEDVFEPRDDSDLQKEFAEFGFHGLILEKIVAMCGIQVPIDNITTMRYLQELVLAGGEPAGNVRNQISKWIPRLAFAERQEGINASSLKKVFTLLSSDGPIPRELYLHHTEFWTQNRMKSILSCFGQMVPSFFVGNQKILATTVSGKNAQGAQPYSSAKPPCLQVKSVPLASAAIHWESMMNGGWVMASASQVPGGRVFRAQEGNQVWGDLGQFLSATVARYGSMVQEIAREQGRTIAGRKRGPDDDEENRKNKRQEFEFSGLEVTEW